MISDYKQDFSGSFQYLIIANPLRYTHAKIIFLEAWHAPFLITDCVFDALYSYMSACMHVAICSYSFSLKQYATELPT